MTNQSQPAAAHLSAEGSRDNGTTDGTMSPANGRVPKTAHYEFGGPIGKFVAAYITIIINIILNYFYTHLIKVILLTPPSSPPFPDSLPELINGSDSSVILFR